MPKRPCHLRLKLSLAFVLWQQQLVKASVALRQPRIISDAEDGESALSITAKQVLEASRRKGACTSDEVEET
jgi:hypothetical protein